MSEGSGKSKKAGKKPKAGEASVLGSLPAARPNRLGGRRRDGATKAETAAPEAAAKPKAAAAKPAAKPKAAAAKPAAKPGATKSEAAAPKAAQKAAAKPKAEGAAPKAAAPKDTSRKPRTSRGTPNPAPRDRSDEGGPPPVRPGAPALQADAPEDRGPAPVEPPSGTELVTTVVQAAGELAQIGLTVGGQIIKRAVGRLPRP